MVHVNTTEIKKFPYVHRKADEITQNSFFVVCTPYYKLHYKH